MRNKSFVKFSISLPFAAHEFIREKSEAQFNRPISQLIAEAIEAMQKSERRLARSKKAKAGK